MSARVYCGRLPATATEKDLENLLKAFGKVRDVDFKEGYAYVIFKESKDADRAVTALNNSEFQGSKILMERAKEIRNGIGGYTASGGYTARTRQMGPPVRSEFRVIVENLSTRAKWLELKEFMNNAGEVCFADTHRRRPGEGVVEFTTEDDMKRAISSLDKSEFYGKIIRLKQETPKSGKSRSRSPAHINRRKSRSRSRSPKKRSRSPRSRSRKHKRRSRSRSNGRRSRSRNRHKKRSRSRSHSKKRKSRSHSTSRDRSKSHKKSKKSHHKSRSRSKDDTSDSAKSRSRSRSPKSKKKSKSKRHSRSRSLSPQVRKAEKKRRKSRSRSASSS